MRAKTLMEISRWARNPMLAACVLAALSLGADRAAAQSSWNAEGVGIGIMHNAPHQTSAGHDIYRRFLQRDYFGSKNGEYIVHLPSGYARNSRPVPLVMVLHGCDQDHRTIKHDTNFDAVADEYGFIVVYPMLGTSNRFQDNCWGELTDAHIHKGGGEVQDLREIIEEVRYSYCVDPNRVHITGFSSGGGMAVAEMLAHSELIASGSVTAGLPYGETPSSVSRGRDLPGLFKPVDDIVEAMNWELGGQKRSVPILIIHSTNDCNINIRASENLRDAWGKVFGVDTTRSITSESGVTKGTPWTREMYGEPSGRTVIETLFIDGMPHGWYGGRNGKYAFSNAPDTTRLTWLFFQSHPLNGVTAAK